MNAAPAVVDRSRSESARAAAARIFVDEYSLHEIDGSLAITCREKGIRNNSSMTVLDGSSSVRRPDSHHVFVPFE